jgi:hypothetical protein
MVRRTLPNGGHYFEPPFTAEEAESFYRHFGGAPKRLLLGGAKPRKKSPPNTQLKKNIRYQK